MGPIETICFRRLIPNRYIGAIKARVLRRTRTIRPWTDHRFASDHVVGNASRKIFGAPRIRQPPRPTDLARTASARVRWERL